MTAKAKFCPHCGETLSETEGPFCKLCGASLAEMDFGIKCHMCHGIIQDTDLYCRYCQHFTSFDA